MKNAFQAKDLSHNHTIAKLTRLTSELRKSRSPDHTIGILRRGLADISGFVASILLSTRGLCPGQYRVLHVQLDARDRGDIGFQRDAPAPVQSGGVIGKIIGCLRPQLIEGVHWSADPFFREALTDYRSVIAIPVAGDHVSTTWVILLKKSPERFTVGELEKAVERVALAGALLENQTLARELDGARQKIEQDAQQVGQLQRALLPQSLPSAAGLEVAISYEPSGRAGGDLYDFFPLDELDANQTHPRGTSSRWCIFIGDIAGHGLAAAVVAAILQTTLHVHPSGATGPAQLLAHVNRYLCGKRIDGFATAFLAIYEPRARRLTYANAGHPSPLLRRASNGSISAMEQAKTYPLRIDQAQTFTEADVELEPGDTMLLYTDGITEARGPAAKFFGEDRLSRLFQREGARPSGFIEQIRAEVRAHEHDLPPADDQTLVAVRVLKETCHA